MQSPRLPQRKAGAAWRIGVTVAYMLVVQTVVFGLAVLPTLAFWLLLGAWTRPGSLTRVLVFAAAAAPSYMIFAVALMFTSGLCCRALGWRTPEDLSTRIADMEWPLLRWVQFMTAIHVVRVFSGLLLRGTPVWTAYLRLCGARLGRRVYVNSLALSDYNLLEFGDDVVIGADVHIAGHTVEDGLVKSGRVRLGRRVIVGVGSIVGIGVEAEDGCQVGALSLVPKHMRLEAGVVYVGVPVRRLTGPVVRQDSGMS